LGDLAIQKLAISPVASEVVLASSLSGRLYHTQDAGNTWQEVATSAEAIEAIGFSTDGQTAIAVTPQQVLISRDRGQSWQLLNRQKTGLPLESPAVAMQAVRRGSSEQILVATRTKGIFQTSDQGMTWRQFIGPIDNEQVEDLVVFKTTNTNADPQIVVSTAETGLFSWDGQQWQPKTQGLQTDPQADEMKQPNFTDLVMTADGQITFLAGFDGFFKSADQGQQWQALETLARGTIVALAVSTNSDNTTIAAVDYVGDIRISYDSGKTWTIAEEGLQIPWFTKNFNSTKPNQDPRRYFDVAFSPDYNHDETIWATVLYTKLAKTHNAGKSWIITSLPTEQRGLAVAASPNFAADKTIYVVPQSGAIYQSLNGGKRFQKISEVPKLPGNFGASIAISPEFASDRTLYVTGGEGIYQSVNGGRDWQAITKATPLAEAGKMQIVISPNFAQDQTLFVSTSNQGLFQSKDGGKTWNQQKTWPDLGDELPYFEAIAISPNYAVDQTLLVSVRGSNFKFKRYHKDTKYRFVVLNYT